MGQRRVRRDGAYLGVASGSRGRRPPDAADTAARSASRTHGSRILPWADLRGLSVTGRSVYAVTNTGSVRLPCVRLADLAAVSAASGGRLPQLPEATPKYAPSRRLRR